MIRTLDVGGKFKVDVYPSSDTNESVKQRIAIGLGTLPKWLIIPSDVDLLTANYVDPKDLLSTYIMKSDELAFPIDDVPVDLQEEAFRIFIATHKSLAESADPNPLLLAMDRQNSRNDSRDAWDARNEIVASLYASINKLTKTVEKTDHDRKFFDSLKGIESTPSEIVKINYVVFFNNVRTTSFDLFDHLHVNDRLPFAAFETKSEKTFYKAIETFIPPESATEESLTDAIFMLVDCYDSQIDVSNVGRFITAWIRAVDEKVEINFVIPVSKVEKYVNREEFVDRIVRSFHGINIRSAGGSIPTIKEIDVTAYTYLPRVAFDPLLFSDMVMNDDIISRKAAINEWVRATKKSTRDLYIHLYKNDERIGTCKMANKLDDTKVRCRIQSTSTATLDDVKNVMTKLFEYYLSVQFTIKTFYEQFWPRRKFVEAAHTKHADVETAATAATASNKGELRDASPKMFVDRHNRQCQKQVTVVSDEDLDSGKYANYKVMKFPTKGEAPTLNFVCDSDEKLKYPGLIRNQLDNAKTFPYLPCCYAIDQSKSRDSNYAHYFFGAETAGRKKHVQDVYSSDKILPAQAFGTLPFNMTNFFRSVVVDPRYEFLRIGVGRSPLSAVECVLTALHPDETNVEDRINEIMPALTSEPFVMACKQEMYSYSVSDIADMMKKHFKAASFFRALEMYFDCNIFVFTADKNRPDSARLLVPNHAKMYVKFRPTKQTIFLYEHWGSERDNLEYTQCEILGLRALTDKHLQNVARVLDPSTSTVKGVFDTLVRMSTAYVNSVKVEESVNALMHIDRDKYEALAQRVDAYGKCRSILIGLKNAGGGGRGAAVIGSLIVKPCPPYALKEETKFTTVKDFQLLYPFIHLAETQYLNSTGNFVSEIAFANMGFFVLSPKLQIPPLTGVPTVVNGPSIFTRFLTMEKTDDVATYGDNYRLAEKMKIAALDITAITSDKYDIVVNENVTDVVITSNDKLKVPNDKTAEGLIFETKKIIKYHIDLKDKSAKNNLSSMDFTHHDDDVDNKVYIVEGKQNLDNELAILKSNDRYILTDKIRPELVSPYFILFRGSVHIVQFVDSPPVLENALYAIATWMLKGYNPIVVKSKPSVDDNIFTSTPFSTKDDIDVAEYTPEYLDANLNTIHGSENVGNAPIVVLDYHKSQCIEPPFAILLKMLPKFS